MKLIIYGAGQVGYNIAAYLAAEDNDVIVIDESLERVNYVSQTLDVQAVQGQGSYPEVLAKVGAGDAQLLIAVSDSDELNILTCQVAHSIFKIPTKIAYIRNEHYLNSPALFNEAGIGITHIISPEREVAKALAANLQVPGAAAVINLETEQAKIIGLRCHHGCPLIDTSLEQLPELFPNLEFRILTIVRDGSFLIPDGGDQLQIGDEAYILVDRDKINRLLHVFGVAEGMPHKIVIAGGGRVGAYLAQQIFKMFTNVDIKMIELDGETAQGTAHDVENAVVLQGNALDPHILREANLANADVFVSVMNDDQANILAALLGKSMGVPHVLTLVSRRTYLKLLPALGIDKAINPSAVTMSHILRHVRQGTIRSVHVLKDGFGEIFETDILQQSKLIGEKFKTLNISQKSILGGVIRHGVFFIPQMQELIEEGDHLILLIINEEIPRIEKLFKGNK